MPPARYMDGRTEGHARRIPASREQPDPTSGPAARPNGIPGRAHTDCAARRFPEILRSAGKSLARSRENPGVRATGWVIVEQMR